MKKYTERETTCRFCGERLIVTLIEDDGTDWLGHARTSSNSEKLQERCNCTLGRLVGEVDDVSKMCYNCKHCEGSKYCVSYEKTKQVEESLENFEIEIKRLEIKNPDEVCEFHEFSLDAFLELLEE